MVQAANLDLLVSKREAIPPLFIYVILEQGRQERMANAISRALQILECWEVISRRIGPYTPMLFRGPNTPSMDLLIVTLSPYVGWCDQYHSENDVIRWVAAASAVPYTEKVGRDIVSVLLQIAFCDPLRPHIPVNLWAWLKGGLTSPPSYRQRYTIITNKAVRYIRGLGDIEIFKSLVLLPLSEHNCVLDEDYMEDSLREEFCGIGMWGHRKDIVERLERCSQYDFVATRISAGKLRDVLLEVETEAAKTLIRMLLKL
jgi:hypothetical protein